MTVRTVTASRFALSVAAAAILFVGCGGGEGDGPAAPTNDIFITKADAICSKGATDLQARVTATFGNLAPTEEEGVTFTSTETVPLLAAQIVDLRALTPPSGDEETVAEIWDAMEAGVDTLTSDPEAAFNATDPLAEALDLARSYGFRSCGALNPGSGITGATGVTGTTGTTGGDAAATE